MVDLPYVSDHVLITGSFSARPPPPLCPKSKTVRAWRNFPHNAFRAMVRNSPLCVKTMGECAVSVDEIFTTYDRVLRNIADELLPQRTVVVNDRPLTPWFDRDCRLAKRRVRLYERRYRKSKSAIDCQVWVRELERKRLLLERKETDYWNNKLRLSPAVLASFGKA